MTIIHCAQRHAVLLCLFCFLLPGMAGAVPGSGSHIEMTVDGQRVTGDWFIVLSDIAVSLELDTDRNGEIDWNEIRDRRPDIEDRLRDQLHIFADGVEIPLRFDELAYGLQSGEPSIHARFSAGAAHDIGTIGIENAPARSGGTQTCCQVQVHFTGAGTMDAELARDGGRAIFSREAAGSGEFLRSTISGIKHIWLGYDHVLFLLVLLIPAVFQKTENGRESVQNFSRSLTQVVIVVSAFTVAHSLTLTLAAMQWVRMPSRLVETAIAISVLLAALHNFLPGTTGKRSAWLASGFGLLHGFGFASVLGDAVQGNVPVLRTLVGFNLGVEIGQLAIVAVFLPFAYLLRDTRFYRTGVVYGGSGAVCAISVLWIWGRAF